MLDAPILGQATGGLALRQDYARLRGAGLGGWLRKGDPVGKGDLGVVHTGVVTCQLFRSDRSRRVGGALANPSPVGVPSAGRVQPATERRA
jgi:hypothetical protein